MILTDDESIVREGISSCIDWPAAGFELVACFENGLETIEYLESNHVDLVISDINMPIMDGLTMSQKLYEEQPQVKVVLLTGYDEFEYAREAVNNHVSRFLLKPITSEELFNTLQQIHEELEQLHRRELQQQRLQKILSDSKPVLKERFLNRLIRGKMPAASLYTQAENVGWHSGAAFHSIAVISPIDEWSEIQFLELTEFAGSLLEEHDELFRNYDDEIVLLLQGVSGKMLEARTQMLCEQLYNFSQAIHSSRICIGIGPSCSSLSDLPDVFTAARNALRYSTSIGLTQVLSVKDFKNRKHLPLDMFTSHVNKLIELVKTGRSRETAGELDRIFELFDSFYMEPEEAEMYLGQLNLQLQQSISEIVAFSSMEDSPSESIPDFRYRGDFQNYRDYIRSILAEYEDFIQEQRHHSLESRIRKAKAIIEDRFKEKDFSLTRICDELYLSTSQFSVIFKEGLHMTFLEYLTNRRIEEAKLLLKTTDLKAYEIADQVGFSDPRYFSIVFKKYCGTTAMQYRRSVE